MMTSPVLGVFGISGGELVLLLIFVLIFGVAAVAIATAVAYAVVRSLTKKALAQPPVADNVPPSFPAEPKPASNLAGSQFHDVNLSGADFRNVDLTNARFHDVNLSNVTITAAQMGGAAFKHVGPPPGPDGRQERQRPVRFEEMMLCDSVFRKVDLSNARIMDCDLTGLMIDGVLLTDLVSAYQRQQNITPAEGLNS